MTVTYPKLAYIEDSIKRIQGNLASKSCLILRNTTAEGIKPYLRYILALDGFDLTIHWGHYDNILQDASGLREYSGWIDIDTIIVWFWLEAALSKEPHVDELGRVKEFERISSYCKAVIDGIRSNSDANILWMGFENPIRSSLFQGAHDKSTEEWLVSSLNTKVKEYLSEAKNAFFVSTQACLERVGEHNYYDRRYWYSSKAPFSRDAMAILALEMGKHFRNLNGCVRKLLVLDADQTLWGGIVGEDGIEGIELGDSNIGLAYIAFQRKILELRKNGVILALCSKNNYDDVVEVFRRNPDMPLSLDHFSAVQINWDDKPSNILKICSELNLGLGSVVFVDDSEYEINIVRDSLPEVVTIRVDPERPHDHVKALTEAGWFDKYSVTSEDLVRSEMYCAERKRVELKNRSINVETFLESLELEAHIFHLSEEHMARAAQLCQRTNQFNSTSVRYTTDQLNQLTHVPNNYLVGVKLQDKFGAYGMVGIAHILFTGNDAVIELILMSCRALGRGVETAILASLANFAKARGCGHLFGKYERTKKNVLVEKFFINNGFSIHKNDGDITIYKAELTSSGHIKTPWFVKVIDRVIVP